MTIKVTYNVTDVYMSQSVSPVYITVSYSDGGTSGGGVWGTITGTLSNQTDLQTALDLKLDESTIDGGTEGQILSKVSGTDFDFAWINNYAKYLATNVRNQTGSTIAAFQVVYISGATGNKPLVSLADADTEATSSKTYGVTATAIANNGTGDVVTAGELTGINTSAFNEGDLLWLSTTAGGVVTTPPAEPAHAVFIGYVVRSHPNLGTIDVSIQNGYELTELHGVQITSAANNDGLFYNTSTSLWENKSIATALGFTPVPTTRTITINGVTFDLSADRSYTVAAGLSGTIATGQVAFATAANTIGGSNNLFWDNANGRLGIGTNAPLRTLNVNGRSLFGSATNPQPLGSTHTVDIVASTTDSPLALIAGSGNLELWKDTTPTRAVAIGMATPGNAISNDLYFSLFNGTSWNTRFVITNSTGNISIGTTSDLGVRLGVVGDTLLRGSGATSATTALTVQNSDGTQLIRMQNQLLSGSQTGLQIGDGTNAKTTFITLVKGAPTIQTRYLDVITSADILYISGGLGVGNNNLASNHGSITLGDGNYTLTNPTQFNVVTSVTGNFFPTSGSASFIDLLITPTINQTGGANGVSRGLLVRPILTAAADWRSIEWSNNTGWGLYGAGTANNYLAGNLGIGITPTVRLHVSGDTILRGSGATSATTALTVQNSSSTNLLTVRNDGNVGVGGAPNTYKLNVVGNANIQSNLDLTGNVYANLSQNTITSITVRNANTGNNAVAQLSIDCDSSGGFGYVGRYAVNKSAYKIIKAKDFFIQNQSTVGDISILNDFATGNILFAAGGSTTAHVTIKSTGQTRFVPLASAPLGAEAGDVYYDSTLNKLRVYTTAWETITSI